MDHTDGAGPASAPADGVGVVDSLDELLAASSLLERGLESCVRVCDKTFGTYRGIYELERALKSKEAEAVATEVRLRKAQEANVLLRLEAARLAGEEAEQARLLAGSEEGLRAAEEDLAAHDALLAAAQQQLMALEDRCDTLRGTQAALERSG